MQRPVDFQSDNDTLALPSAKDIMFGKLEFTDDEILRILEIDDDFGNDNFSDIKELDVGETLEDRNQEQQEEGMFFNDIKPTIFDYPIEKQQEVQEPCQDEESFKSQEFESNDALFEYIEVFSVDSDEHISTSKTHKDQHEDESREWSRASSELEWSDLHPNEFVRSSSGESNYEKFSSKPKKKKKKKRTQKKLNQCKECKKIFARKFHLTNHFRIHTNEKPFVCSVCEWPFAQKGNLVKHFYKIHKVLHPLSPSPFYCYFCRCILTTNSEYRKHLNSNHDEKFNEKS